MRLEGRGWGGWGALLSTGKQGKSRRAPSVTNGTNNAKASTLDIQSHRREKERERQPGSITVRSYTTSSNNLTAVLEEYKTKQNLSTKTEKSLTI